MNTSHRVSIREVRFACDQPIWTSRPSLAFRIIRETVALTAVIAFFGLIVSALWRLG
jgi:hypothetical protein